MVTLRATISPPRWLRLRACVHTCGALGLVMLLAGWFATGVAHATRVQGLYGAEVDATGASGAGLDVAFDAALGQVLVKVTGLSTAGDPANRKRLFPNPAALVQQYGVQPGNKLRVDFDPAAFRRALDKAGLPLWDADRPLVAVWLAIDAGGQTKTILSAPGPAVAPSPGVPGAMELGQMRDALMQISGERGLPIVLPLLDANDVARISFDEVWNDDREAILAASERYGAEAVLVGHASSLDINEPGVNWTLLADDAATTWQGTIAAGPAEAATILSRELATRAATGGLQRVAVTGVDTLAQYGNLLQYFRSLAIVERAVIVSVDGRTVEFDLMVRGDAERLRRALNTSPLLVATAEPPPAAGTTQQQPPFVYTFRTVR